MSLKLNVYDHRDIVKTYTAETYDLMMGTVEDLLEILNLDQLQTGSDVELIKLVGGALLKGKSLIYPLLLDIFDGLTEAELRNTKAKEVAKVIVDVVRYSVDEISKGASEKN